MLYTFLGQNHTRIFGRGLYCKRLNFLVLKFLRIGPKLKSLNYSRVLIFTNRM
ncbi:MAG: hypothetical protein PV344_04530 [Anaplasma sp.]|nr:hypothetical protein [Anaplasma sp.]